MITEKGIRKPTQEEIVLEALLAANGAWVCGEYLLRGLYISQFHTRIYDLQQAGIMIEASPFRNEHKFKSYRLILEKQEPLF